MVDIFEGLLAVLAEPAMDRRERLAIGAEQGGLGGSFICLKATLPPKSAYGARAERRCLITSATIRSAPTMIAVYTKTITLPHRSEVHTYRIRAA